MAHSVASNGSLHVSSSGPAENHTLVHTTAFGFPVFVSSPPFRSSVASATLRSKSKSPPRHSRPKACHITRAIDIAAGSSNAEDAIGQKLVSAPRHPDFSPYFQVQDELAKKMREVWIRTIKELFRCMALGEISISAYDTAWVALVPALDGSGGPQFPRSLDWIMQNQLPDGSWGYKDLFLPYDRVCSTLACVMALRSWNMDHESINRGLAFLHGSIAKVEAEVDAYMPVGFEIVFPAMLEDAQEIGLHLPHDSPTVKRIQEQRERKLER